MTEKVVVIVILIVRKHVHINAYWNETQPTALHTYLEYFKRKSIKIKDHSCQDVYPPARLLGHKTDQRLMVKSCPYHADTNDVQNCLNPESQELNIPLVESDHLLYANSYCARCNFINKFVLVNITAACENVWPRDDTFEQLFLDPNKTIYFSKNLVGCVFGMANDFSGGCFKESYNSYCDYNNKYHELCRLYKAPVGNYKNYHCWKCNTMNSSHIATKEFKYCDNPRCAFGADCILSPDPPVVPHFR